MKFLMLSKCGEGANLLHKIAQEGNDVRIFIQEPDYRTVWKGLLSQVSLRDSWIDKGTIVIADMSGLGQIIDQFREEGHPTFAGSEWADELEHDRAFGLQMMQQCGIKIPKTYEFTKKEFYQAEEFVKDHSKTRFVFKPSGDDLPTKLTYSCSDSDDLIRYMQFVEEHFGDQIESFVLQEFVKGTLVSSEFWCDGKKFIGPANHTVETKKLMNDDLGPSTGCSGNLVWPEWDDDCEIIKMGIIRAESLCVANDYRGPIDLNAIVNDKGIFGLEWTPRFGYDAMPTFLQLLDCEVGKLISDCSRGQGPREMDLHDLIAGGIRLSIPPYPIEPEETKDVQKSSPNLGIPIRGIDDRYRDNCYFFEIMADDNEEFVHSDGTGIILVTSDIGDDSSSCLDLPTKILEEAKIPDKQYRTDLKKVLPEMYKDVMEFEGKISYAN